MKTKITIILFSIILAISGICFCIQNYNRNIRQDKIIRYFDSCRKYNSISSDILWGIRLDMINGVVHDSLINDRIYCNEKANLYQDSLENCLKP